MSNERIAEERGKLLSSVSGVPTSGLSRLWRTGRSAGALAAATLGNRLRGKEGGLAAADVEDIVRLVERLGELKGVAMKVGQILGYIDPTLPPELRGLLSLLHTAAPASPFEAVEATLREAFGARAEELIAGLSREPVAAASIGQVHRGRAGGVDLAVKVRHPGIRDALRADFGAASIGPVFARVLAPGAGSSVSDAVAEAREAMLEECDFLLEARRQTTFGGWFKGHHTIRIPSIEQAWCADAVLASRWAPGLSLDDWLALDPPQGARDRVGAALFELYFGTLYRRGAFHADPHPGNYAFAEDGGLTVYDFGCVRAFDAATVGALARLVVAVRRDDPDAIAAAFTALGGASPGDAASRETLRALLRGFFAPLCVAGPHRVEAGAGLDSKTLFADKKALMKLAVPGKLLFLFRIRFGLYAVLARIGAVADWAAMETAWAAETGVLDRA